MIQVRLKLQFILALGWVCSFSPLSAQSEDPNDDTYKERFHERFGEPSTATATFDQLLFDKLYMGDQLTAVLDRGIDNEQGSLAWGLSYMMQAYNQLYRYSGDTKYLEATLECARHALKVRDDKTGRALWTGETAPIWGADGYAKRGRAAFAVHTGMIAFPILEMIALSEGSTFFSELHGIEMDLIAAALEQSIGYHDRQWREGPGENEGHYIGLNQEDSIEGKPLPGNRLAAIGLAHWHAWEVTGEEKHRERAVKLGRYIKSRLAEIGDDAYYWKYQLPEEPPPGIALDEWMRDGRFYRKGELGEDISHAALTIALPLALAGGGDVFEPADVRRFAETARLGLARRGDGILFGDITGSPDSNPATVAIPARWLPAVKSSREATRSIVQFYLRYQPRPGALDLALLIRFGRQ